MPKEHLTMYILDFLESYSKQKGSSDPPAIYLIHYLVNFEVVRMQVDGVE